MSILPNRYKSCLGFLIIIALVISSCQTNRSKSILVFTKTAGYKHASIPDGVKAIQNLGSQMGFKVDTTSDATMFNEDILAGYDAVVFLSTTGNVLNHYQQADFERFIQAGGGFVGVHAAADTEYDWPWYNELVGAYFLSHPHQQDAILEVIDKNHPATVDLPSEWTHYDEWYNYRDIADGINVLINLDESSYEGGENGENHPIAWSRVYDGGRMFYTGMGHTSEAYSDPTFLKHLKGGIQYVLDGGRKDYTKSKSQRVPLENRFKRDILLTNLNEPMEVDYLPEDKILFIERAGDVKLYDLNLREVSTVAHINVDYVSEDGLLGLAVDPNYPSNNWIYLFYTPKNADKLQRLSRFELRDKTLDLASEQTILEFPSTRECCHSGGSLEFDAQGNLYISTGDNTNPFESDGFSPSDERPGRSVWDAQKSSANTNDLRGKVIRIKPEDDGSYSIPKGNLFEDDDPRTRPEIYVMGVRNAFRMSIDQENGNVYWGDVGPDAGKSDSLRGPYGIDEINQAKHAGNWGWPYTRGNNIPYWDYDFDKKQPRKPFDPNNLINDSPNNTGLQKLPPAQASFIWYPYDASPEFPWVGTGGRTAMAGPVFRKSVIDPEAKTFPDYFEGKLFIYEWMRDWIYLVTMDENDAFVKAEPFMEHSEFHNPMDMVFGKDGSLYIIEYGESWNTQNLDAQLNKISYIAGNRVPIARISADKSIGASPMTVKFTGDQSEDLEGGNLTYLWSSGDGQSSTKANPSFTFSDNGNYTVKLTVTDPEGLKSEANYQIATGNAPSKISVDFSSENIFYNSSGSLGYEVNVQDPEDGSLSNNGISSDDVFTHLEFLPEGIIERETPVGHQIEIDMNGKTLIDGSDCKACHAVANKINGPSYQQIAQKYSTSDIPMLVEKVLNGGSGVWGETPMAAHPQLDEADVTEMVEYIMSLGKTKASLPVKGELKFDQHNKFNLKGTYLLTVSYTDKGAEGISPITSTEQFFFQASVLEAEAADDTHPDNTLWNAMGEDIVGNIKNGHYLGFDNVLLDGLKSVTIRGVYNEKYNYKGTIELRLGAVDGPVLGQVTVDYLDNRRQRLRRNEISLSPNKGKDKLYVVFKRTDDVEGFIMNADHLLLNYSNR